MSKMRNINSKFVKRVGSRLALGASIVFIGSTPVVYGCDTVTLPDGTVVTIEDQTPTIPIDDPEIIDTTEPEVVDPEPEVVEPVEEEVPMPSIVLYDENGDYYQPQDVTLDEMYDRIDYANEKYEWKSKWDRDRFVAMLLYENACYMQDEDIKTLYYDYLGNFGINQVDHEQGFKYGLPDEGEYRTMIDLEDLFIDPVSAEEARRFQIALSEVGKEGIADYVGDEISQLDITIPEIHSFIFEEELSYISYDISYEMFDKCMRNCPTTDEYRHRLFILIDMNKERVDLREVDPDTYKSSHVDEMTK